MTWQRLLNDRSVQRHSTSGVEIANLLAVADRNLGDASIDALSADARFGLAYDAARALASMVIAAAGYRTRGQGAHATTFRALPIELGAEANRWERYFDTCRRKRNTSSYDAADLISESEAAELLENARQFREHVLVHLRRNHAHLLEQGA